MDNDKNKDYSFLWEEKKKKTSGMEIAIIILGAFSIVLSFFDIIFALITSAIGLILSNIYSENNMTSVGKIGFSFCKLGIVLAPSVMLIKFMLGLLLGITLMSSFTNFFLSTSL